MRSAPKVFLPAEPSVLLASQFGQLIDGIPSQIWWFIQNNSRTQEDEAGGGGVGANSR